jgi:prevent-host-death family protein
MQLQESVKPISYVKAHAAELIKELNEFNSTIIVTQNGEAKAVLQDIGEYERIQESISLLKILALSRKDIEAGRIKPADEAFKSIRQKISDRRNR